ncbi:hypothetical protein SAMN04488120_10286 [Fontimonas thermophila]|uniref:Copper(I)-binding protein n=1 Tax=Fontimonas thermophila TaxID=1076937 RepID=A0A1I2HRU4_9GAMM|nr:copper chaperone PCu(A)C [Fontimonas thermophila]SFF31101.1 hypothetical protein SAMN04488120_10286 [Fontimonas thermophila]
MNPRRAIAAVLAIASASASAQPSAHVLSATDAWIREAPPGATVMAGYVVLHNAGAQPIQCHAARGDDFGAIEIHRTVIEDGRSRMLRDQTVEVPPHGRAELAPGGYHLMLFRPQRPFTAGDTTRLRIDCGEHSVETVFTIRKG